MADTTKLGGAWQAINDWLIALLNNDTERLNELTDEIEHLPIKKVPVEFATLLTEVIRAAKAEGGA